eukprot:g30178.t1
MVQHSPACQGFIYIVLLRFLIGPCVWCAVLLVQLSLILGGAACYIKSFQCAGSSIFETGQQVAVAVTVTVQVAATNAATGSEATSEALTGDGADYGGVQYRTKSGYACETWGSGVASSYTNPPYTTLAGAQNYCRNPYVATQTNKASTIWCFTTDPQTRWEECTPVGVIQPVCASGYAVTSEEVRKVLEIAGYVVWGFAFIYWLLVCCFFDRIQLAIAVNKVAATFVSHTMRIIGVPIVQAVVGILWILLWGVSVSFLVSQVPADYTPTGTTIDGVPACWKCSPPRYVFDYRFAVSFFVFLWNNALNIAIGQCIIAGAVGVWFFTPNAEKGKRGAIKTSVWNVFRYHLGSLAFGSFIIAVIQFIRYLMNYFEKQAKAQKNRVMALILRCLQCCMYCFEQCIRFLNKNLGLSGEDAEGFKLMAHHRTYWAQGLSRNAYIQIALMGTNFCTSAKAAFFLILRNALRFGTVALLSTMVNLIGFFFIVAASVGLGYLFLQALHPDMAFVIPLLMYAMMAYVVAKLFLNVFGLAVDSTLQCFLACEEMDLLGDFVPGEMSKWLDKGHSIEDAHKKDVEWLDRSKDRFLACFGRCRATTDLIVKELICSNTARDAFTVGYGGVGPLLTTAEEQQAYLCTCCLTPCSRCSGSHKIEHLDANNLESMIGGKMSEFTGSSSALFDPNYFTQIWSEATKYFNLVCLPSCDVKCVPMPGAEFTELVPGYCSLGVTGAVSTQLGSVMSDALGSMSSEAFQSELAEFQNFGTLFGDAIKTADTFALVAVPERMRMETQK